MATTAPEEAGSPAPSATERRVRGAAVSLIRRLPPAPVLIMALVVGVTYLRIVWLLPRGFDWTDESFIMSMTASNRTAVGEPWGFQYLLNPLYHLTGESVLAFRVLRLLGYVALSAAVVSLAWTALRRMGVTIPRAGWALILIFAQVGTFMAWSYPPRYLSHNELASWFAQVGVALILLTLAWGASPADRRSSRILWLVWLALGVTTTVLVFAKVTSGVAFAAVLAVVLLVPSTQLRLWQRVAGAAAGGGGSLLLLWLTGVPIGPFFDNVLAVATDGSAQAAFGHPLVGQLSLYLESLATTGNAVLPALVVFALAMALMLRRTPDGPAEQAAGWGRLVWVLAALLALALLALPRGDTWVYLGYLVAFVGAASVIGFALVAGDGVVMGGSAPRRITTVAVGGCVLIAAPFIASVGTNAVFVGHFLFTATLWCTALGIALVLLGERARRLGGHAHAIPALLALLLVVLAAVAVENSARHPYRMAALEAHGTPTTVPELRGLLLTAADAAWIDWVAQQGDALGADGVPAVAISSPGALYAFNNSAYAHPWTEVIWPSTLAALEAACDEAPSDLFVLQPGSWTPEDGSTAGVVVSFATCGLDFPADFDAVATYPSTDPQRAMTIWRLSEDRDES